MGDSTSGHVFSQPQVRLLLHFVAHQLIMTEVTPPHQLTLLAVSLMLCIDLVAAVLPSSVVLITELRKWHVESDAGGFEQILTFYERVSGATGI